MTRVVIFADGFTSASAPELSPAIYEEFTILNNQASFVNITGLVFAPASYTTFFIDFELLRSDSTPLRYEQAGRLIGTYDGSGWTMELGSYVGDSVLADSLASVYNVQIQITSGGQIQYKSGNMGASYVGTLKASITRMDA